MEGWYQGTGKVDACCPGVGRIEPFRLGETKELVAAHRVSLASECAVVKMMRSDSGGAVKACITQSG